MYLVLNQVLPLVLQKTRFVYTREEVYCWDDGTSQVWDKLDIWLDLIALAVPVVPITISCVLSCIVVGRKGKYLSETASGGSANKRATRTIILMTAVYILFNIPLFVNYLLWTISVNTGNVTYPDPYWNTTFTYWFVWNFTDCLFINLNSLFNPLVYFMRIKTFKEWVCERCRVVKGKIASTFVLKCL